MNSYLQNLEDLGFRLRSNEVILGF